MASNVPQADRQSSKTNSVDTRATQSSLAGETLTGDELELHLWQNAYFMGDGSNVRHTADSLRLRLAHLQYYSAKE